MDDQFPDYYQLLMIASDDGPEEIRRAYLSGVKYWHPDNFHRRPAEFQRRAHDMTVQLGKAYEILSDPEKRERYDALLAEWLAEITDDPAEGHDDSHDRGPSSEDISTFLSQQGFEVVDNRQKGGALWVVVGSERSAFFADLRARGFVFEFRKQGGRASGYRSAWFLGRVLAQARPVQGSFGL